MIVKLMKRRTDEFRIMLLLTAGIFLIATILFAIIMNVIHDAETTVTLGTMMIMIGMGFFFIITGVMGYSVEFNLAIGMGVTRRQFIPAYMITSLCMFLLEMIITYVVFMIEKWEIRTFYGQYPYEKSIEELLFSPYVILFILAIVIAQIFLSALTMKFGRKVFWGLWCLIMLLSVLPGKVTDAMEAADGSFLDKMGNQIVNIVQSTNSISVVIIIGILLISMLIGTYFFGRKQAYHVF